MIDLSVHSKTRLRNRILSASFVIMLISSSLNYVQAKGKVYTEQELLLMKRNNENNANSKFEDLKLKTDSLSKKLEQERIKREADLKRKIPEPVFDTPPQKPFGFKARKTRYFWGTAPKKKYQDYKIQYKSSDTKQVQYFVDWMWGMTQKGWSQDLSRTTMNPENMITTIEVRMIKQ